MSDIFYKKAADWLVSGDTGASSLTIFHTFYGGEPKHGPSTPLDCYDFGRCFRLLLLFPEWGKQLHRVAEKYPIWEQFVKSWPELERLYCQGMASGGREFNGEHFAEFRALILPLNGWPV